MDFIVHFKKMLAQKMVVSFNMMMPQRKEVKILSLSMWRSTDPCIFCGLPKNSNMLYIFHNSLRNLVLPTFYTHSQYYYSYLLKCSRIVGILQIIAGHCIDHAAATSLYSVDACLSWLFSHAIDYTTKDDWLGSYSLI